MVEEALAGIAVQDGMVGGVCDGLGVPGNDTCLVSEFPLLITVIDLHEVNLTSAPSIGALPDIRPPCLAW